VTSARASPGERKQPSGRRSNGPGLRRTPGPRPRSHSAKIDVGRRRVPTPRSFAHRGPPPCRAATKRRPQQPPGPVRAALDRALRDSPSAAATSATGRSSTYMSCQTSRSGLAFRPERGDRLGDLGGATALPRPGHWRAARPPRSPRAAATWPDPGGAGTGRPAAGRSPHPRPRRTLRPVAPGSVQTARKVSCRTVLDVRGGQHRPEPGSQPRAVPAEQLPQRRVIPRPPGHQCLVVHRPSIAPPGRPVHESSGNYRGCRRRGGRRPADSIIDAARSPASIPPRQPGSGGGRQL